MPVIAIRCPHCGGGIRLDDDREFGFCKYCGTRIRIEDHVVNNITNNINDHRTVQINRLKKTARIHLDRNDFDNAGDIISEIGKIDDTDPDYRLLYLELFYRLYHSGHYLLSDIEKEGSCINVLIADYESYRKYSGDPRSIAEVIKSFGLPPYDVESEIERVSSGYGQECVNGHIIPCTDYSAGGFYDLYRWAEDNRKLFFDNHQYYANVLPVMALMDIYTTDRLTKYNCYDAERILNDMAAHSPGAAKLIGSKILEVHVYREEKQGFNRLTGFSAKNPDGLDVSPLISN